MNNLRLLRYCLKRRFRGKAMLQMPNKIVVQLDEGQSICRPQRSHQFSGYGAGAGANFKNFPRPSGSGAVLVGHVTAQALANDRLLGNTEPVV